MVVEPPEEGSFVVETLVVRERPLLLEGIGGVGGKCLYRKGTLLLAHTSDPE